MSFFLIAMTFVISIIVAYFAALVVAMILADRDNFIYLAIPTAVVTWVVFCFGTLLSFFFFGLIGNQPPFQNPSYYLFSSWVITSGLCYFGLPASIFLGVFSIKTAREEK